MSRKKRDFERKILPDPKYGDLVLAKAINILMIGGKKGVAEHAVYGALDIIADRMEPQSDDEGNRDADAEASSSEKGSTAKGASAKGSDDEILKVFHRAIDNIRPVVEVRSRRVGGATYQVPTEVNPRRSQALALRWLKDASNSRGEKTIAERLAFELMDAYQNRGTAVRKREDTHKMADANKAFAHFKW